MKTDIGPYDADTRTVPVTFDPDGVAHQRPVNACHGLDGTYDRLATAARIAEVARGVAVKIAIGVIDPDSVSTSPTPAPTGTGE